MLLLATQAEPQMRGHRHPNLGRLLQPRHTRARAPPLARACRGPLTTTPSTSAGTSTPSGVPAHGRHAQRTARLPVRRLPRLVGEAGLTSLLFEEYAPLLWRHDLPPACVLQEPGVEYDTLDPPGIDARAVHRRGHDELKLGPRSRRSSPRPPARHLDPHGPRQQPPQTRLRRLDRLRLDRRRPVGRFRDIYLNTGLHACAAGEQLRM